MNENAITLGCYHTPQRFRRVGAPRRKVVHSIAGLNSFECELSCGHWQNTGPWRTSFNIPKPAPKTMGCKACDQERANHE